jgi:hypothetical protein
VPMYAMYPPLLDAACRQSKSGVRNASLHDDSEVEINILTDGCVQVKLFIGRAGTLQDWAAVCTMRAAKGTTATDTVARIITFQPR